MAEVLQLAVAISGINNFSGAFGSAISGLSGIGGAAGMAAAGLATVGLGLIAMGAQAAVSFSSSAVELATTFEREMKRVQAVTGATAEEFEELSAFARMLGSTTEFTATQSAEAMTKFGLAGFEIKELYETVPQALDLATASMADMSATSGILSNVIRAYGLETSDATHVADVMTETFTNSFTTIESLRESFKMVAPVASAAGISFESTAAAIGKLGDAGLMGSLAGTGLRQSIARILNPSEEALKVINRLGLELQVFSESGEAARSAIIGETAAMVSLQSQQESTKSSLEDLKLPMSELTTEIMVNDLAIAQQEVVLESIRDAFTSFDSVIVTTKNDIDVLEASVSSNSLAIRQNNVAISDHQTIIDRVRGDYVEWEGEISSLEAQLQGLQDVLGGFALDTKKNQLAIMQIRQEADRKGKRLTKSQLAEIHELEEANDELRIKSTQASIEQIETQNKLKEEQKSVADANKRRQEAVETSIASELLAVNELTTTNVEMKKQNELSAISKITMEASLAELETQKAVGLATATANELASIGELQIANDGLSLQKQELSLGYNQTQLASESLSAEMKTQKGVIDGLNEVIQSQVIGTVGYVEILKELERTGASTSEVMQIFQIRGGTAMLALMTQGVEALEAFQEGLENSDDALANTAAVMRDTFFQQVKILQSAWQEAGISIGLDFIPMLGELTDKFTDLVPTIKDMLGILPQLFTIMIPIVEMFINAIARIATMNILFDVLSGAMTTIVDVIETLSPLFDLLVGVFTVSAPQFETAKVMMEAFARTLASIIPILDSLLPIMELATFTGMAQFGLIIKPVLLLLETLAPSLVKVGEAIGSILTVAMEAAQPLMDIMVTTLADSLQPAFDSLIPIIDLVANLLSELAPVIGELLVPIVSILTAGLAILGPIFALIPAIIDPLIPLISALFDVFIALLPALVGLIPIFVALIPLFELLPPIIELLVPLLWLQLLPLILLAPVIQALVPLITFFAGAITMLSLGVAAILGPLGFLPEIFQSITDQVKELWDVFKPLVDAWNGGFGDFLKDINSGTGGAVESAGKSVGGTFKNIFGFHTGTGLEGVPESGNYRLTQDEIVLNRNESDVFRQFVANNNQNQTPQKTVYNINIGTIQANTEREGRNAIKGVFKELESRNIRGDVEVV